MPSRTVSLAWCLSADRARSQSRAVGVSLPAVVDLRDLLAADLAVVSCGADVAVALFALVAPGGDFFVAASPGRDWRALAAGVFAFLPVAAAVAAFFVVPGAAEVFAAVALVAAAFLAAAGVAATVPACVVAGFLALVVAWIAVFAPVALFFGTTVGVVAEVRSAAVFFVAALLAVVLTAAIFFVVTALALVPRESACASAVFFPAALTPVSGFDVCAVLVFVRAGLALAGVFLREFCVIAARLRCSGQGVHR